MRIGRILLQLILQELVTGFHQPRLRNVSVQSFCLFNHTAILTFSIFRYICLGKCLEAQPIFINWQASPVLAWRGSTCDR